MKNKEATKYLISPTATSTKPSAEYLKQKEAYDLAIKALETVETDIEVVAQDAYKQGYTDGWKERFGEPNEKPQGEWIDYDNTFYKCPDCGYLLEKCCPQCQNKVILPKGGADK